MSTASFLRGPVLSPWWETHEKNNSRARYIYLTHPLDSISKTIQNKKKKQ
jgi:hypothetical protein